MLFVSLWFISLSCFGRLGERVYSSCETRFVAGCGVAMQYAFSHRTIDDRDNVRQKFYGIFSLAPCYSGAQILERCSHAAAIISIHLIATRCLAVALLR